MSTQAAAVKGAGVCGVFFMYWGEGGYRDNKNANAPTNSLWKKIHRVKLLIFREESKSELTHIVLGGEVRKKIHQDLFVSTLIWIPLKKSLMLHSRIVILVKKFVEARG